MAGLSSSQLMAAASAFSFFSGTEQTSPTVQNGVANAAHCRGDHGLAVHVRLDRTDAEAFGIASIVHNGGIHPYVAAGILGVELLVADEAEKTDGFRKIQLPTKGFQFVSLVTTASDDDLDLSLGE